MRQILSRIPLYIEHYLKRVDEHSLQAPFIYNFCTQILSAENYKSQKYPEIEAQRRILIESKGQIDYSTFGKQSSFSDQKRNKISTIARYGISSEKKSQLKRQSLLGLFYSGLSGGQLDFKPNRKIKNRDSSDKSAQAILLIKRPSKHQEILKLFEESDQ